MTFMRFAKAYAPRVSAMLLTRFAAEMATTQSFQADMTAWDPERNQPILLQVKYYGPPKGRSALAHELGLLKLSCGDGGQTNATAEDSHAERLAYEHVVVKRLPGFSGRGEPVAACPASSTSGATGDSSRVVQSDEPVWLSWTRGRFGSRLSRAPAQMTADAPTANDPTIKQGRSTLFGAAATGYLKRLSVTFGTAQLARDYRAAQLRLASSILAALRLMFARLVSAIAHQRKAPAFLLVMLATARHYGHRSEPDHRPLLASVLKPPLPKGAACLVT